jgi:hypothetical protein
MLVSRSSISRSSSGSSCRIPSSRPATVKITIAAVNVQTKLKANIISVSQGLMSPRITATRRLSSEPSQPRR